MINSIINLLRTKASEPTKITRALCCIYQSLQTHNIKQKHNNKTAKNKATNIYIKLYYILYIINANTYFEDPSLDGLLRNIWKNLERQRKKYVSEIKQDQRYYCTLGKKNSIKCLIWKNLSLSLSLHIFQPRYINISLKLR